MARRRPNPPVAKAVTFRPDPEATGYGTVDCNWEDEPRDTLISLDAARKFAEGWKATFNTEALW
jgi:hypothetical protein